MTNPPADPNVTPAPAPAPVAVEPMGIMPAPAYQGGGAGGYDWSDRAEIAAPEPTAAPQQASPAGDEGQSTPANEPKEQLAGEEEEGDPTPTESPASDEANKDGEPTPEPEPTPAPRTIHLAYTDETVDVSGLTDKQIEALIRQDEKLRANQSALDRAKAAAEPRRTEADKPAAPPEPAKKPDPRLAKVHAMVANQNAAYAMAGLDQTAGDELAALVSVIRDEVKAEIMAQLPPELMDPATREGLKGVRETAAQAAEVKANADWLYEAGHDDVQADYFSFVLREMRVENEEQGHGYTAAELRRFAVKHVRENPPAKNSENNQTHEGAAATGGKPKPASPGVAPSKPAAPRAPVSNGAAPTKPGATPAPRNPENGQFAPKAGREGYDWSDHADNARFAGAR